MKPKNTIEASRFAERLKYDPDTGSLTWKPIAVACSRHKTWNSRFAGKEAGSVDLNGYVIFGVFGRLWKAHRVGWALAYGEWPEEELDHINGERSDNRLANLRLASRKENCQNFPLYKSNTSGFMGVHRHRSWRRWQARIRADGKRISVGWFDTPEEAYQAYLAAKAKFHRYDASGRI